MRNYEKLVSFLVLVASISEVAAWTGTTPPKSLQSLGKGLVSSRQEFLETVTSSTIAVGTSMILGEVAFLPQRAFAEEEEEAPKPVKPGTVVNLPNGVSYSVIKSGTGPLPQRGELIAIRFAAYFGDNKLDDIFDTPEPYYTRVGSGGLIKGVEETIPLMHLGDRWKMVVPGELAFGKKGRPASAGKPRVPADATINFELEVVGLPGREPELIELIGDY